MNWEKIQQKLDTFISDSIGNLQTQGIQVMNELIIRTDYLEGSISILVQNPASMNPINMYDEDVADYIVVGQNHIEEWLEDVHNKPSLSEEEFHQNVLNIVEPVINKIQQDKGFEVLNPTMPFSVDLKMHGFPEKTLLLLGAGDDEDIDEREVLKSAIVGNYQKSGIPGINDTQSEAMRLAQEQMKQMYANIPGMENFEVPDISAQLGQAVDNLLDGLEEEGDWQIIYSSGCTTTPEQQKALAVGAIMKVCRDEYIDMLEGGDAGMEESRVAFANQWDASDRESALDVLQWLKNTGHRQIYDNNRKLMDHYAWYEMEDRIKAHVPELLNAQNDDEAEELIYKSLSFYFNMKHASRIYQEDNVFESQYPETICAWDYGRLVNVACWCVDCGYIDEDEAWEYIEFAYQEVKKTYNSWSEFAHSYLFGRHVWNIEDIGNDTMKDIVHVLLNNPESPWVKSPLNE